MWDPPVFKEGKRKGNPDIQINLTFLLRNNKIMRPVSYGQLHVFLVSMSHVTLSGSLSQLHVFFVYCGKFCLAYLLLYELTLLFIAMYSFRKSSCWLVTAVGIKQ